MFVDPSTSESRHRLYIPGIEFCKILHLPKFSPSSLLLIHYNKSLGNDGSLMGEYMLIYHKYPQFYD